MGRLRTVQGKQVESDLEGMLKAQKMAEAFANHRTRDFLRAFLEDTGLADLLYETQKEPICPREILLNHAIEDYLISMGKGLALAYACGYCDAIQKKTIKQLYVPGTLVDNATMEEQE